MRLVLTLLLLGLATGSGATDIVGTGLCAEADPHSLRIGLDDQGASAPPPEGGQAAIARAGGPVRHRLSPTQVSAGPAAPGMAPPTPDGATQVGACNSASSVCGGAIQPNPQPIPVASPSPGTPTKRPRIVIDPDPDSGPGGNGFSKR